MPFKLRQEFFQRYVLFFRYLPTCLGTLLIHIGLRLNFYLYKGKPHGLPGTIIGLFCASTLTVLSSALIASIAEKQENFNMIRFGVYYQIPSFLIFFTGVQIFIVLY